MRVRVSGGSGFVALHVEQAAQRAGHTVTPAAPIDAAIHVQAGGVRAALDEAWRGGARLFVLASQVGARARSSQAPRAAAGRAEELVRASGLPWIALRPEIVWGPGDVFTRELAHLIERLPFVPIPRGGVTLSPVHVGDLASALVAVLDRPELAYQAWSLRGPETLRYGEVVARIAEATPGAPSRRLRVPAGWVRRLVALEERLAGRAEASRRFVDWRVSAEIGGPRVPPLPVARPRIPMTVDGLRLVLGAPGASIDLTAPG